MLVVLISLDVTMDFANDSLEVSFLFDYMSSILLSRIQVLKTKKIFQQWRFEVQEHCPIENMHDIILNKSYLLYLSFASIQVMGL